MEVPDWLNQSLLEGALQEGDGHRRVSVTKFSVSPATATGDNFTSYLCRVKVDYTLDKMETNSVSLIIKIPAYQGVFKELSDEFDYFGAEPLLYNHVLPSMSKKMKCVFYPKSFPCSIDKGLILEDLKPDGYVSRDRFVWLDFKHCKMVVNCLAKFHAGSVACHKDNPELVEKIGKERLYAGDRMKKCVEAAFRECAKALLEIGGDEKFANLLLSRADVVWETAVNLCKPRPGSLNVLNHGDPWISNMLFKYTVPGGEVSDLKLVDFQLTRYGSPALDLIFFIWTSANEEVRENLEELYKVYLQTLNKSFEDLGCQERMTLEMLQEDIKSHVDWILIKVCFTNGLIMREKDEFIDVGSLTKEQLENINSEPKFPIVYRNKHYPPILLGIARQLTSYLCL